MKAEFLSSLLHHSKTNDLFYNWIDAVLLWADKNGIDIQPHRTGGRFCVKLTLHDSVGPFFDFIFPMSGKKGESSEAYQARVASRMFQECAELRKDRIVQLTGRQPAAKAA